VFSLGQLVALLDPALGLFLANGVERLGLGCLVISLTRCASSAFTCKRGLVSALWPFGPDSAFLPWQLTSLHGTPDPDVESWPLAGPGSYLREETAQHVPPVQRSSAISTPSTAIYPLPALAKGGKGVRCGVRAHNIGRD
jgi:hypothetical protein